MTTETVEQPDHGYLQSDEPISGRANDRLNRAELAHAIADQVAQSPPKQGFVIALDGPWGSGKTSVLNMIEESVVERSDTDEALQGRALGGVSPLRLDR